jgi:hypothetical protein
MTGSVLEFDFAPSVEMAPNANDGDWIRSAIQESIEQHYKGKMARFCDWFPTGALVAVALFLLIQWNAYTEFRVRTEDRLANIEGRVLKSEASHSPRAVLSEIGKMRPKEFVGALPALRVVAEQPLSEVKPSSTMVRDVSTRLLEAPESSPEYWPTVLQFIRFASSGQASSVPLGGSVLVSHNGTLTGAGSLESGTVKLDGASVRGITFKNCRIIFTTDPTVLENVTFINYMFEMPIVDNPIPYIRRASELLLASDFRAISIKIL